MTPADQLGDFLRELVKAEVERQLAERPAGGVDYVASPDYLTAREAAGRLKVAMRTLQDWRLAGEGPPHVRVGGRRILYPKAGLDAWLAARTRGR